MKLAVLFVAAVSAWLGNQQSLLQRDTSTPGSNQTNSSDTSNDTLQPIHDNDQSVILLS